MEKGGYAKAVVGLRLLYAARLYAALLSRCRPAAVIRCAVVRLYATLLSGFTLRCCHVVSLRLL
jgi:hypothetical protein